MDIIGILVFHEVKGEIPGVIHGTGISSTEPSFLHTGFTRT